MQITREEYAVRFPGRGEPVPAEYAGQWVAWNEDRSRVLAHGPDLTEVRAQAIALGCVRPLLQRIPRGPFVGSA
jgi:hypothetical protein